MEWSHGDQMESSAAAGFPPASTPPTPHPNIPLSHRSPTLCWSVALKLTPLFPRLRTHRDLRETSTAVAFFLLLFVFPGAICVACVREGAEFNLSVLEGCVHPAMHPGPSQCINPRTQPGTVSPGMHNAPSPGGPAVLELARGWPGSNYAARIE